MRRFLLAFLLLYVSSCANKVSWHQVDGEEKEEAYLVDFGYHAALILKVPEGGYWKFAHGDWSWFALQKNSWWHLPRTLFWPTDATLGRHYFSNAKDLNRYLQLFDHQRHFFQVDLIKSLKLIDHLNQKFHDNADFYYNHDYRLEFIRLESKYHAFNNCNHQVVDWLRFLGTDVNSFVPWSRWSFQQKSI